MTTQTSHATHLAAGRISRRDLMRWSLVTGGAIAASAAAGPGWSGRLNAAGIATPVASPASADHTAAFAELGERIVARMAELRVPGVAVGVVADGVDHTAGFGVTNVDHPAAVDPDTLFQIGSTSKTYTGTALMRLVERGAVDLDATVRTYLPEFRVADEEASERATVRDLATHTGGWFGDDFTDPGDGDEALARYVEEMADLPQIAPVGTMFSYNNAGLATLGRVIEVATGMTYEAAIADLVLAPLGLERSFLLAEQVMTDEFAVGHAPSPEDPTGAPVVIREWALPRAVAPAGGVISSVRDQLAYARFHLGDGTVGGERVLQATTLDMMQRPVGPGGTLGADMLDGVGITWMITTAGGERIALHGGSTNGQQSTFLMAPDRGFAVTVLTNAESGAILAEEAAHWALELFLGLERAPRSPVAAAPERLAEYVGAYQSVPGLTLHVEPKDGGLYLTARQEGADAPLLEGAMPLVGEDLATLDAGGLKLLTDFVRDGSGGIGWVRLSGRLYPKVG